MGRGLCTVVPFISIGNQSAIMELLLARVGQMVALVCWLHVVHLIRTRRLYGYMYLLIAVAYF